jgi:hypothetical protein
VGEAAPHSSDGLIVYWETVEYSVKHDWQK